MLVDANTGAEVRSLPNRNSRELDEVLSRLTRGQAAAMENKIEELHFFQRIR